MHTNDFLYLSCQIIDQVNKFGKIQPFEKCPRSAFGTQIQCLRARQRYHFNPEFVTPFYTAFEKNKIRMSRNSFCTQSRVKNAGTAKYIH